MNDSYVECMVKRKTSPLYSVVKGLVYFLTGVCLLLGAGVNYILLIPAIGFILLIIFVIPNMDIEYEYLYLDREISIDKIMSKQKRKRIKNIELSKMEFICPINSHELDSYKARNVKITDYTSKNPDAKVFVLVYNGQNGNELISFEPNGEMLKAIKGIYPRKVIEY